MPAVKTLVSNAHKLLGLTYSHFRDHGARATAHKAASFLWAQVGGAGLPSSAESVLKRSCPELNPLSIYSAPRTKPRLNLVLDGLSPSHRDGDSGSAVLLGALLAERRGFDLRLITRRYRTDPKGFAHLLQLLGITLPGQVELKHADCEGPPTDIDVGARELFLTTSCATTLATLGTIAPDQIVFLVQDDERLHYPYGDERLRCEALLKTPRLTFLVSSKLLFDHLLRDGVPELATHGRWFEPAVPAELYFPAPAAAPPWRFFYSAWPRSPRHLFHLGLAAIEQAAALGILNKENWELHLVGSDIPSMVLPGPLMPKYHERLSDSAYAALVRKMDLGLSLLGSPHPGQEPLALAASGAVVVTNRWGEKQTLSQYSRNIFCAEPTVESLVASLAQGVQLAQDRSRRRANYQQNGIVRDWRSSLGPALDYLAQRLG